MENLETLENQATQDPITETATEATINISEPAEPATKPKNSPQSRKWQLTFQQSHIDDGWTHERIRQELQGMKSLVYWCMASEVGALSQEDAEPKLHTHLFIASKSPIKASTLANRFPTVHREPCKGSYADNRDYIAKTGRWAGTDKANTTVEGSFEAWGEIPQDIQGGSIEAVIMQRVLDGATNAEILMEFPSHFRAIRDVEYTRQTLRAEENRNKWRDLEVTYIWGATGAGKTRSVMDGYGYSNVYAVNNYKHPFDGYAGEDIMLFDEFNTENFGTKLRIQDMNNYLDGYPLSLPARYSNKIACYDKVFIISNIDLTEQYKEEQRSQPEVRAAFLRRIHKVIQFMPDGTRREYSTKDYITANSKYSGYNGYNGNSNHNSAWTELPANTPTPFDDVGVIVQNPLGVEQMQLTEQATIKDTPK